MFLNAVPQISTLSEANIQAALNSMTMAEILELWDLLLKQGIDAIPGSFLHAQANTLLSYVIPHFQAMQVAQETAAKNLGIPLAQVDTAQYDPELARRQASEKAAAEAAEAVKRAAAAQEAARIAAARAAAERSAAAAAAAQEAAKIAQQTAAHAETAVNVANSATAEVENGGEKSALPMLAAVGLLLKALL